LLRRIYSATHGALSPVIFFLQNGEEASMKYFSKLILLMSTTWFGCYVGALDSESAQESDLAKSGQEVIGGAEATSSQFPWQVRITVDGQHQCGGSLIRPTWVLTAGHCVEGLSMARLRVILGDHLIEHTESTEQVLMPSRFIMHPNFRYVNGAPVDDVALIELTAPATLNSAVQTIALQRGVASHSFHTVSGWGWTQGWGSRSNALMHASIPVVDNANCNGAPLARDLFANELCAGYFDGSRGGCHGDSGGPLVTQGSGLIEQVGVVSWGQGGSCGTYTVFARVSSFVPWIESILGQQIWDVVRPNGYWSLKGDFTNIIPGDFNGDGRTDFIRQEKGAWDDDDVGTAEVYLSNGNGYFTVISPNNASILKGDFTNIIPGDFNGDGRKDFIRQEKGAWDDDDVGTAQVYLSNGNGYFTVISPHNASVLKGDFTNIIPGDFNGDGRTDLIRQEKGR
jgi:hypothetical protein